MNSAEKYVSGNNIVPLWVKVDCVNSCKICTRAEFEEEIRSNREFFFKNGSCFIFFGMKKNFEKLMEMKNGFAVCGWNMRT